MKKINSNKNNTIKDVMMVCNCVVGCSCNPGDAIHTIKTRNSWEIPARDVSVNGTGPW